MLRNPVRRLALGGSAGVLALCQLLVSEPTAPEQRDFASERSWHDGTHGGTALFRGRLLSYVVEEGMAVHSGDMVLGPADDFRPGAPRLQKRDSGPWPSPRTISANSEQLWTDGLIPYEIAEELPEEQQQYIREAIEEWNAMTVIRLQARDSEQDYVSFELTAVDICQADVGMVGGKQRIYIPPNGCSVNAYIHEIGHAVGLWHEHEREDRDQWVMVLERNLDPTKPGYSAAHPSDGPYDYSSAMHYSLGASSLGHGFSMETIPPGMSVPSARLSPGDIDGVARLYGKPSETTVVSTNPPGLELVIDGERRTTPVGFDWAEGTSHSIEAPLVQATGNTRFLFGRWNLGHGRVQTIKAGPDATWIEANFIVQHAVGAGAEPENSGSVELQPASPDGFYTARTPIQATATPRPGRGYEFLSWSGTLTGRHGRASNPAPWLVDRSDKVFEAQFTTHPFARIEANVELFLLNVRGYGTNPEFRDLGPTALYTNLADGGPVRVGMDDLNFVPGFRHHRYKFRDWGDEGPTTNWVTLPRDGGVWRANLEEQVRLSLVPNPQEGGTILPEPLAPDRFYAVGSTVRLLAQPRPGWEFVGWTGSQTSFSPSISLPMDGPESLEARFSRTRRLQPGLEEQFSFPASKYNFNLFDADRGYRVHVPEDAVEVEITFDASVSEAEVALFVHADSERLEWDYGPDGRTPEFEADYRSSDSDDKRSVIISSKSDPPLRPGTPYYVSLARLGTPTDVDGSIVANVRTSPTGVPQAHIGPRAFTFVALHRTETADQVLRVENRGVGPLQFTVVPDRGWLDATPDKGVIAPGHEQEVVVTVAPAGWAFNTHRGTLRVTASVDDDAIAPQAVDVSVALVILGPTTN